MRETWRAVTGVVFLGCAAACGERAPATSPVPPGAVDAAPRPDAAPPDAAPPDATPPATAVDPCTVMRREGDFATAWSRARERRLETVVRRFHRQHVASTPGERRRGRRLVFGRGQVAPAALVGPCVADWRAADPGGVLDGATGAIVPDHRYVEAGLDFDDDGTDESYTFFVDVESFEVVAAFYALINTP